MKNYQGSTIWARQTLESDIFYWKPAIWFKIWFYIINKVNHADNKQFKRGEGFFNFSLDRTELRWCTPNQWKKCIHFLKTASMIETKRSTRGMIIKVNRYEHFQDLKNSKGTNKGTEIGTSGELQGNFRGTPLNKNDINVKNDKNESNGLQAEPAGVNQIFDTLYEINPTLNFGNRSQRKAAGRLIQRLGLEKATNSAKAAIAIHGKLYAPTITTPAQLETKLSELVGFYKKQNQGGNLIITDPNV